MKQKFKIGEKVFVKVIATNKSHFTSNFYGIVRGSYYQLYGGGNDDKKQYSICQLNDKDKIVNEMSWYDEDELIRVGYYWDRNVGRDLLEAYDDED